MTITLINGNHESINASSHHPQSEEPEFKPDLTSMDPLKLESLSSVQKINQIFNLDSIVEQLLSFAKFSSLNWDENKMVVALQLPDEFLWASSTLVSYLSQSLILNGKHPKLPFEFFVLADTQYSSCCVDEVAAQHFNAELIIHFGRSCLSTTRRVPVIFAFEQQNLDLELLSSEISIIQGSKLVIYDVNHAHLDWEALFGPDSNVQMAMVAPALQENGILKFERISPENSNFDTVIYVGPSSPAVTRFSCAYSKYNFLHFDPATHRCESPVSLYKKRYYMMQKAKSAQTIGIVVGTLGVSDYLDLIKSLKEILRKQGKKCYTFALGKLNVPKLANFSEIDLFVLVACPESTIIDSKEFFRPVITPYEMIMALESKNQWEGSYEFDFQGLLSRLKEIRILLEENSTSGSDDEATQNHPNSSQLIVRDVGEIVLKRNWRGLELDTQKEKSMEIIHGRHGIASHYQDEPKS